MSWTHIAHPRCPMPLFGLVSTPHGSIWKCDHCGKRWMVDRTTSPARWVNAEPGAMIRRIADEYERNLSKDPADVGRRELAAARIWLKGHVNAVYADLGLERTR